MISIKNLTKRYKNGTRALNGITINLNAKVTAILGRNGAGKTTMLRILSTQLLPTGGSASINGLDVVRDAESLRKTMLSIPQEAGPIGVLTPYEHIELYLSARGVSRPRSAEVIPKVLKELDLWSARDQASDELSGGMKRKIFVAMALASDGEVVFMDEPTVGLDPISRLEVWSTIKKLKSKTIVLSTHYIEEAKELAQDIVLVDSGKVVSHGSAEKLLRGMSGRVRVESTESVRSQYKIGGLSISYVKPGEASRYIKMGFTVKPMDIEDLFIIKGKRPMEIGEEGGWSEY